MYTQTHGVPLGRQPTKKRKARYGAAVKRHYPAPVEPPGLFGNLYQQFYWFCRRVQFWLCYNYDDPQYDEDTEDMRNAHTAVPTVAELSAMTGLSRSQVKFLYRGFKQQCPTGLVNENDFKRIYGTYFPLTHTDAYASRVFAMFDTQGTKEIPFQVLLTGLCQLQIGSPQERLKRVFRLIDTNNEGKVNFAQFFDFVYSVFMLSQRMSADDQFEVKRMADARAKQLFRELDLDGDGYISECDFQSALGKDPQFEQSIENLIGTTLPESPR